MKCSIKYQEAERLAIYSRPHYFFPTTNWELIVKDRRWQQNFCGRCLFCQFLTVDLGSPLVQAGFPLFYTHKIPGFFQDFIQNSRYNFLFFSNVASTYNWVSVYTLHITSTPFCLHYPKVCIPPLTATHNDLYHFERWILIKKKKKTEINDLMAAK